MEIIKAEVIMTETANTDGVEPQLKELNEIQLALVGGGIGTVVFG